MKNTIKLSLIIALGLSLNAIGCGDDESGEEPFCVDGTCGDDGSGGGPTGSNCNNSCQSPTVCNTSSNKCEYTGNNCNNSCGPNTYCDTSSQSCKPNTNSDDCGNNCGTGTVCKDGACVPGGSGGSGGGSNCGGSCGAGTHCNGSVCVPDGSGGNNCGGNCAAGTHCDTSTNVCVPDGSSGGVDVRWIPTLSTSTLGYVNAALTSDGSFNPQSDTVTVTSADGITAVCAILYGSTNKLMCNNGSCRYLNALKNVLAPKHGQSASNESYVAGNQGLMDAAADLVACATSSYSSCLSTVNGDGKEFLHRCDVTNSTCQDNDPVGNSQSQIACALVGI